MRTLFLTAKFFSGDEPNLTVDHICSALERVEIINDDAKKILAPYDNDGIYGLIREEQLLTAEKQPVKPFDDEVKELITQLKANGLTFSSEITKPYEHSVVKYEELPKAPQNKGIDLIKAAKEMKLSLSDKIYGQDRAIESITDSIKNNILASEKAPKSTYLFLGPPATGKTYLAELIGENLSEYKVKKFDMTQYSHSESGGHLYGTSRQWGNAKPGALTSFVRKNPKSIIVLDEFEKANNQVQTNLLSIFEGGYLQDACGWCQVDELSSFADIADEDENGDLFVPWGTEYDGSTKKCSEQEIIDKVDFTQAIFVITSNLGKELYSDHKFIELIDEDYTQAESMILDALRREEKQNNKSGGNQPAMVPELVSRFSKANVVLFNRLNYKAYESIADQAFRKYREVFCEQFDIAFKLTPNYKNFLKTQVLSFAPELDARRIQSKIGLSFFDRITDYIMELDQDTGYCKEIKISIAKEVNEFIKKQIKIEVEKESLVRELFRKNMTLHVEDKFTNNNGVITYKISHCEFKRVKRLKDFNEDGFVFDIPEVSFSDIAGHTKAKMRLGEAINFLKHPKTMKTFNIQAPKGMLLYGPPGTGKTLLAKAFAHEADLPFIATTGTDLLDPEKTKTLFGKAKEYAPSIVFIDEIDALGKRGQGNGREIPINKLLSEMDGFSSNSDENVFVVAATNFKDNIDSAIIRPGRIELHVKIDELDRGARKYFLDKVVNEKPIRGEFDMNKLLMYTTGMTGAQLELIGKEASIYCIRNGLDAITEEILIEQINTIKYGEKLTHLSFEQMLEETAIHEAGHAIVSKVLMPHVKIEQITVTPRGKALGFVSYNTESIQNNMTVEDYKNRICVAMAGRICQIKKYGKLDGTDTGASNDLLQATNTAYAAIAYHGMDEEVGYINTRDIEKNALYKEQIEEALQRWLKQGEEKTKELVDEYWEKIEKLSALLLEKEVVYEDEL